MRVFCRFWDFLDLVFGGCRPVSTIEQIVEAAQSVGAKSGVRRIEVSQAQAAATAAVEKQLVDESAEIDLAAALDKVKQTAAELTNTGSDALLDQLMSDVTVALAKRGEHIVKHDEMVAAISQAIVEQAEADAANIDEDAAIANLKQLANDYTKED